MPDDSWDSWGDRFNDPQDMYAILWSDDVSIVDQHAQDLFREAFFEKDDDAYAALVQYMHDEYDLDFEDLWDWEDWAEWYESQ
jgi:hypothetical protein